MIDVTDSYFVTESISGLSKVKTHSLRMEGKGSI